jgi:formylglycine-generating enzyme required for sulfatase activity
LTRDGLLAKAPRLLHSGKQTPALGGIPLLARLGQGGMSAVYFGLHPRLDCPVAVKVLPFHLSETRPDLIERFQREARMAARVHNPHLISVLDVNQDCGVHYLVMEYVPGLTAAALLRETMSPGRLGLPLADALEIALAAADGLAAAHTENVIHRDVKPENILVPRGKPELDPPFLFGQAKLMDLGLARQDDRSLELTDAKVCMGTPKYMAPEQAEDAARAGKPADVFSFGAALYALLTGAPPFDGTSLFLVLQATKGQPHRPIREVRPEIPPALAEVLDRCLQKAPERRFADARALLAALQSCARSGTSVAGAPSSRTAPARGSARMAPFESGPGGVARAVAPPAPPAAAPAGETVRPAGDAPPSKGRLAALRAAASTIINEESNSARSFDLGGGVKIEMALIPAGCFLRGSPPDEAGRNADEALHQVRLSKPFYLGRYSVTQAQYEQAMGRNPSRFRGPDLPVESLSWEEAQALCARLRTLMRANVRLPTEAMWEYACRAGTETPFAFGATLADHLANYNAAQVYGAGAAGEYRRRTTPAGAFPPNPWGLCDLHGNVCEWCLDWYGKYPTGEVLDPQGPAQGKGRVMRGGAWNSPPAECRSAHRSAGTPDMKLSHCGVRIAVLL